MWLIFLPRLPAPPLDDLAQTRIQLHVQAIADRLAGGGAERNVHEGIGWPGHSGGTRQQER
jgi:hypothetical protein